MIGQKANAVRKEAEEQAHEEVSRTLWLNPPALQVVSELGKLSRYGGRGLPPDEVNPARRTLPLEHPLAARHNWLWALQREDRQGLPVLRDYTLYRPVSGGVFRRLRV